MSPIGSVGRSVRGRRLPDAIPDSAVAHYVAEDFDDSSGEWPDRAGENDLHSTGSPSLDTNGINGNPSVLLDGVDDFLDTQNVFGSGKVTIFAVVQSNFSGDVDCIIDNCPNISFSNADGYRFDIHHSDGNHRFGTNTSFVQGGAPDKNPIIQTGWVDGSDRFLQVNASTVDSDSEGGEITYNDPTRTVIGAMQDSGSERHYFDGYIGEILVCSDDVGSDERERQHSRLSDEWGIEI